MSTILEQQRKLEIDAVEQDRRAYRSLVAAAAEGDSLSATDAAKLRKVRQSLGISIEALEADVETMRTIRRAEADAAAEDLAALVAAKQPIADAIAAQTRQLEELIAEHDRARQEATAPLVQSLAQSREDLAAVQARHDETLAAVNRARLLRFQHARLLGIDRPAEPTILEPDGRERVATVQELEAAGMTEAVAEAHRVRWVGHALLDKPAGEGILIERLIMNPAAYGDIRRFRLVPAPGQTDAEATRLQSLARDAAAGKLANVVYIVSRADALPKLEPSAADRLVRFIENIEVLIEAPPRYSTGYDIRMDSRTAIADPAGFTILPHPGQSEQRRDELAQRWRSAYARQAAIRGNNQAGVGHVELPPEKWNGGRGPAGKAQTMQPASAAV